MSEYQKQEILLETGTNEMEIIEFYLGTQSFGINVHKLKEIITFNKDALTVVPGSAEGMLGTLSMEWYSLAITECPTSPRH
ncbi:MAG: hypothetical protein KAU22_00315, partial [Desulfuromonadales bacterium]|nr:hypothetical protein [Desulfuromonadales bacterium]